MKIKCGQNVSVNLDADKAINGKVRYVHCDVIAVQFNGNVQEFSAKTGKALNSDARIASIELGKDEEGFVHYAHFTNL